MRAQDRILQACMVHCFTLQNNCNVVRVVVHQRIAESKSIRLDEVNEYCAGRRTVVYVPVLEPAKMDELMTQTNDRSSTSRRSCNS
jgi:hypothetical protein